MPTRESSSSVSLNASRILGTVGTQPKQQWHGIYIASCVQNNDPLGLGRIKMFIPQVLGNAVSNWARPLGYHPTDIPVPGTMVHAYFAGGDVNQPIWVRIDLTTELNNMQNQINGIGPKSWQSLTLQNGWSNIGGYIPAQVRVITPGVIQIVGHIQSGNPSNNTLIATLPAGYFSSSGAQAFSANVIGGAGSDLAIGSLSGNTDTGHLNDGTISGHTDTEGLPNGTISNTSGQVNGGSAGSSNHTHGPGSYSVTNGQHSHFGNTNGGTLAVTDGSHSHGTSTIQTGTTINRNSPVMTVASNGQMTIANLSPNTTQLSFSATLAA